VSSATSALRLVAGDATHLLLDAMLERFKARGLVRARGKQRTDSTHVLGAARDLHLLELVTETLRATLDDLAAIVPDWLRGVARPDWYERYAHRAENFRLPRSDAGRAALALTTGADGYALLDALDAEGTPPAARAAPVVATLRTVLDHALRAARRRHAPLARGAGVAARRRADPVAP
jgi:transposase